MKKENINENWSKPLARILKEEIEKRKKENSDYNQNDFAEELDLSPSTLTQIIHENRNVKLNSIFNIAEALGCSIDYLLGLTNTRNREWDDIDKAIELFSDYSGISKESLIKINLIKKTNDGNPFLYIDEIIKSSYFVDFVFLLNEFFVSDEYNDDVIGKIEKGNKEYIFTEKDICTRNFDNMNWKFKEIKRTSGCWKDEYQDRIKKLIKENNPYKDVLIMHYKGYIQDIENEKKYRKEQFEKLKEEANFN